ncbi:MAG: dihydrodipicolinate synthase family protein [Thermaerobacter sp.]|jgi:4-hydroxy-tetrahydrodipicolinate synthase|nr:dihydrodipicolinate synthase family protein [Thermaerobacter sp.]
MLEGVWAALPPLERLAADPRDLGVVYRSLRERGVDGCVVFGTTGCGADYSLRQRVQTLRRFLESGIASREVVVAVLASAPDDARRLIEATAEAGVRGVAVVPPFYGDYTPAELLEWAGKVLRPPLDALELYLYNIPRATHQVWDPGLLDGVAALWPLAGIKDSSGDLGLTWRYIQWFRPRGGVVLVGNEAVAVPAIMAGASGVISGLAAAYPEAVAALVRAAREQDGKRAAVAQDAVLTILREVEGCSLRATTAWLVQQMRRKGFLAQ